MIIKIADIPPEGREIEFTLDEADLNERVALADQDHDSRELRVPSYLYRAPVQAALRLTLEGSTVIIAGRAGAGYTAACSRCAEEIRKAIDIPINIILKPRRSRGDERNYDEDMNFGFYSDQEVDCGGIVEEFLIIGLPYTVLCDEKCKGLCPHCGANLNTERCNCVETEEGDERLAVLRNLKVKAPEKH
ncbi:MAG TPA: DUF177 domain-containing protein [Oligoflexia bacterium]|nr:DUF177 domain-containing protein [Oligoflexia bacterium]